MEFPTALLGAGMLSASLVGIAACSAPPPQTAPSTSQSAPTPDLTRFYDQTLQWSDCGRDQCAGLLVPVNYDNPTGDTIELALLRRPATDSPGGIVVINPGGPGASGVEYADFADQLLSPRLLDERDIVGFDPRGVGRSAPVNCGDGALTDALLETDATPDTPAEVAEIQRVSRQFAESCTSEPGSLLGHLSTQDAARDLDVLRAALGQTRLDYLGVSYGTHLGATYARLFPQQVGRFVLDAPVPAGLDAVELSAGQAAGFEDSLRRFIADCQTHDDCIFGTTQDLDAGLARFGEILDALDNEPARTQDDERPLTQAAATYAILMGLYLPSDRPRLRDALGSLAVGDGEPLQRFLDERLERLPDGSYDNNSLAAFVAVTCSDRTAPESVADIDVTVDGAPTLGEYLLWGAEPCAASAFTPAPPAAKAPGEAAPTILVVATTHDPATPLPFAALLAHEIGDAVVITREGDGHTAYREGSECIDEAIDSFLLNGVLPLDGLRCD